MPAGGARQDAAVILLHGLARTPRAMRPLEAPLRARGYQVHNLGYPSRSHDIETLTREHLAPAVREIASRAGSIHFVTHSMGGILVRCLLRDTPVPQVGRVVMLSPPNRGSEVVDRLATLALFRWINGPAGVQLGTGADSIPNRLGAAAFPLGVITGDRSINVLLSLLIPGANDGKVSVERARLEGMADFLVLPHTHPLIMRSPAVHRQVLHFLEHGNFSRR